MDQQLLAYIDQELKRGVRPETVKKALCDAGWESQAVQEAILATQSKAVAPAPKITSAPEEKKEEISFAPASEDKPKKRFSVVKLALGAAALVFAGIAIYLYLSDSFAPAEISEPNVLFERENVPPAGEAETGADVLPAAGDQSELAASEAESAENITESTDETSTATSTAETEPEVGGSASDKQRKADMVALVEAQKAWFAANGKYYTCSRSAGDCGGSPTGYPAKIGDYLTAAPKDPSGKTSGTCGRDFVYCGLNNVPYSHFFCYYAKLESGEYYTASHEGNFLRKTAPKIFEECAAAD
ncbi:MAG TPA: hypothetical protein PLA19_05235 [Candidatus Pacearchaeota archaeon]|nr:hypothetical protein [Candidatus Pacearchaeota archaeon]